jgi:YidC/Oxa1 family membrane protein insertase
MDLFTVLFYQPIFNLLVILYRAFGGNLGLAIIAVGILVRLIMFPLTLRQAKSMPKNMQTREKMNELKELYKDDKETLNKEMIKLNSESMPYVLQGCLQLILQLIVFINVDRVIRGAFGGTGVGEFNALAYPFVPGFAEGEQFNSNFLGIFDLSQTPAAANAQGGTIALIYLAVVAVTGIVQYFSMKAAFGAQEKITNLMTENKKSKNESKKEKKKNKDGKEEKEGENQDMQKIMNQTTKQTMILLPILLTLGAYNFAVGLSFYWITQGAFAIIQQLYINKVNLRNVEQMLNTKE